MTVPVVTERHVEALTIAMALAPGVYARNRMFDLFAQPGVARAKRRAAILRGIVRQLARATALTVTSERRGDEPVFVLRYGIAAMRLHRVVELSRAELGALRLLAGRAGVATLPVEADDRALVEATLARLLELEASGGVRPPSIHVVPRGAATRARSPSSRSRPPGSPA